MFARCLLLLSLLLCSACASRRAILSDNEYASTNSLVRQGYLDQAVAYFPKKEAGGFITTTEKNWLGLWVDLASTDDLLGLRKGLDDRKVTFISREAENFFIQETEDGYLPAEHEVVASHLVAAQAFLAKNNPAEARVEARRAAELLQGDFNPATPDFDDPALRVWLASLWTALGEWDAAQVDLRRAYEMTKDPELKRLSERDKPPPFFELQMSGIGPTLDWIEGQEAPNFYVGSDPPPWLSHPLSSQAWYERHQQRNTALRDFIMKSNYMSSFMGINARSGAELGAGAVASGIVIAAGVTLGAVLIGGAVYALVQSGSTCTSGCGELLGYLFAAGFGIMKAGADTGESIMDSTIKDVHHARKASLENLRTYRFVRYLPSWFGWSLKETNDEKAGFHSDFKSPRGVKVRWRWIPERESPLQSLSFPNEDR